MKLKDDYVLSKIVKELESVLQIEGRTYEDPNINQAINDVKTRLDRMYHVDFTNHKIGDPELAGVTAIKDVAIFLEAVAGVHSKLCAYSQICRFTCKIDIDLRNVNYLGITEESLLPNLKMMEREKYLPSISSAITGIKERLVTTSYCMEKRLLLIMITAYELGLYEITATIAEILQLSMLG